MLSHSHTDFTRSPFNDALGRFPSPKDLRNSAAFSGAEGRRREKKRERRRKKIGPQGRTFHFGKFEQDCEREEQRRRRDRGERKGFGHWSGGMEKKQERKGDRARERKTSADVLAKVMRRVQREEKRRGEDGKRLGEEEGKRVLSHPAQTTSSMDHLQASHSCLAAGISTNLADFP